MPKDAPVGDRDGSWIGVNTQIDPTLLPPGLLADGANMRCRTGQPTTRLGRAVYAWANRWDVNGKVLPFSNLFGTGVFKDPRSTEWLVMAADGGVWRTRPNNSMAAMSLPSGIQIVTDVTFCQAFDKLFMFRGRYLAPLVLTDIDTPWKDIVDRWNSTATYASGAIVARGPWQTAASVTGSGATATVTTATEHGLITGSDIEMTGITPAAFNVRATITVVDPYTFTYSYVGGAYVSGTGLFSNHSAYWKAASGASAGQEPGVHVAWTRDYAVLPNGDNAISSQNRLLVPTWWQFDNNTAGSPGSYKAKRDYVAASDYLDYIHVALNQYFRINQGSSDELLVLREVRPGSVAAFKTGSVFLLDDVIGDLSTMSQRRLPIGYGLVNAKAIAQGGSNLHWMAPKRGVVSLVQTINNEIQGVDVPLSEPIQPWIDRINWAYGSKIRMEFWDNKLFVAVPLDDAIAESLDLIEGQTYTNWLNVEDILGWTPGVILHWTPGQGSTELLYANGEIFDSEQTLEWNGDPFEIYKADGTEAAPASTLKRVLKGVNNTVLIYDFQRAQWQPMDTGPDLSVREWCKLTVGGEERLFAAGEDGLVWCYEATDNGDMVWHPLAESGVKYADIAARARTRAYMGGADGVKAGNAAAIAIATWDPTYSLSLIADGVNESTTLVNAQRRSRTRYIRPATALAWDPTNVNDDFETPWREDYSIAQDPGDNDLLLADGTNFLLADGSTSLVTAIDEMELHDGVPFDRMQDQWVPLRLSGQWGRSLQLEITNTTGRITLRSVNLDMERVTRSLGVKV